jgi:hypothetical protein
LIDATIASPCGVVHGYVVLLASTGLCNCLIVYSGEQSVGKSFALNHLVDTSFAGSAMRTTEGVWMSLTPTNENLIVALDFEGDRQ